MQLGMELYLQDAGWVSMRSVAQIQTFQTQVHTFPASVYLYIYILCTFAWSLGQVQHIQGSYNTPLEIPIANYERIPFVPCPKGVLKQP